MRFVRILILPAVLAVLTLALASPAPAADVSGQWKAEFNTQIGMQKYTFDLKVDGQKLTGKATFERMGQSGEAELKEGKVAADTVSFVETFAMEGNEVRIDYTGKLQGDEIRFTRKVGEFATEEFVATRVKK